MIRPGNYRRCMRYVQLVYILTTTLHIVPCVMIDPLQAAIWAVVFLTFVAWRPEVDWNDGHETIIIDGSVFPPLRTGYQYVPPSIKTIVTTDTQPMISSPRPVFAPGSTTYAVAMNRDNCMPLRPQHDGSTCFSATGVSSVGTYQPLDRLQCGLTTVNWIGLYCRVSNNLVATVCPVPQDVSPTCAKDSFQKKDTCCDRIFKQHGPFRMFNASMRLVSREGIILQDGSPILHSGTKINMPSPLIDFSDNDTCRPHRIILRGSGSEYVDPMLLWPAAIDYQNMSCL
jgi:hypothetical protein